MLLNVILFLMIPLQSYAEITPLVLTKVSGHVYSAIGVTDAPSKANKGHNNNLSVVISNNGVLVVNGGASYKLAKALHLAIKQITKQKVVWVVNENSQGHAFLGNSYWSTQGAKVIAHESAVKGIKEYGQRSLQGAIKLDKAQTEGTFVFVPEYSFKDKKIIQLGEGEGKLEIQLLHFGKAHSLGDISVWLPQDKVLITGDIAFHQRMLGVFPESDTKAWLISFEKMQALNALYVIPGHGSPTDMATITRYTYGYLKYLRSEIQKILDDDGDLLDAYKIDQSAYRHLHVFDELAVKNAGRVFQQMEEDSFE